MSAEKELAQSNLALYSSLAAVAQSEGGQILMQNLAKDVIGIVDSIATNGDTMEEHKLRAACMKLSASLSMYRVLANAEGNMKGAADELDALLNV